MSFALTEPDAGSDSAAVKTRGERDGDDYVLNGTKRFITNAPRAGAFTLMARTDGPGAGGISAFIVPAGLPGITLGKPDKKMGQRGHQDLRRDPRERARAGGQHHRRRAGAGLQDRDEGARSRPAAHLRRLPAAWRSASSTRRSLTRSERKQFGKRIGDFQLIQAMLADSQAELYAGWSMVRDCAERFDAKPPGKSDPDVSMRASCCKLFCTEMVGPRRRSRRAGPRRRRATSPSTRSSASTATCGCCASTKARPRSSKSSSAASSLAVVEERAFMTPRRLLERFGPRMKGANNFGKCDAHTGLCEQEFPQWLPNRRASPSAGTIRCCSTSSSPTTSAWCATPRTPTARRSSLPRVLEAFRHEKTDAGDLPRDGRARPARRRRSPSSTAAPGLNYVCYGLIAREVERVDSGYRSMMSVQSLAGDGADLRVRHRGARSRNTCRSSPPANGSAASA